MNTACYILAGIIISLCLWGIFLCLKMLSMGHTYINNFETHKQWMFLQMYKINPSVTLPDVKVEDIRPGKATIYSPEDDPMREFTEGYDDFFGDRDER